MGGRSGKVKPQVKVIVKPKKKPVVRVPTVALADEAFTAEVVAPDVDPDDE